MYRCFCILLSLQSLRPEDTYSVTSFTPELNLQGPRRKSSSPGSSHNTCLARSVGFHLLSAASKLCSCESELADGNQGNQWECLCNCLKNSVQPRSCKTAQPLVNLKGRLAGEPLIWSRLVLEGINGHSQGSANQLVTCVTGKFNEHSFVPVQTETNSSLPIYCSFQKGQVHALGAG